MRSSLLTASVLLLIPSLAHAQGVYIVDDDGGPGVFATEINAAVVLAPEGATLLVKPGLYTASAPFFRDIRIQGDGPGVILRRDYFSNQLMLTEDVDVDVVLKNLTIEVAAASPERPVIAANGNQGTLWMEDVTIYRSESSPEMYPLVSLTGCANVVFANCTIERGIVELEQSNAYIYDTQIDASLGATTGTPFGAPGLHANASWILASGSRFVGGPGTYTTSGASPLDPCPDGGAGGPGIELTFDSNAWILDSEMVGGPGGGTAYACGDTGPDGEPFKLSGASTLQDLGLTLPARGFSIIDPVRSGEACEGVITGSSGELVWLFLSASSSPTWIPSLNGTLCPAPPTVSLFLGTIGATGKLKFNPVIQLGPLQLSIEFTAQAIHYSLADGLVLGTPQDVLAINTFL